MILFVLCIPLLVAAAPLEETLATKRVYAHLLLRDVESAVADAQFFLRRFPHSPSLQQALIRALCEKGEEVEALRQWKIYASERGEQAYDRPLLEALAWGALRQADRSAHLVIRANALLGAAATRDARAVSLLLREMRSSNALLRGLAVHLAAEFGDGPLIAQIEQMLREEKVWHVRLEVIQAVGKLRLTHLQSSLEHIVESSRTLAEEKQTAIVALVNLVDTIGPADLAHLLESDRAGLRQLACGIIIHLDAAEYLPSIISLLKDPSPEVRLAALDAVGLMGDKKLWTQIEALLTDSSSPVAVTAAWVGLRWGKVEGEKALRQWLFHTDAKWRRLAAAALAVAGPGGIPLSREMLQSDDKYVQANVALGLIGQRQEVAAAGKALDALLRSPDKQLWMWDSSDNPLFRSLAPTQLRHIEHIPHYPFLVDQMVRLELLSALSIVRYSGTEEAIKSFLRCRGWGVSGTAAALLLQEGDGGAIQGIRELLADADEEVRLQAALLLASLGGDSQAVQVLQTAYKQLDRDKKVYILEALGQIGDPQSIPFLVEVLGEPFQVLRIVAASALMQCLYH